MTCAEATVFLPAYVDGELAGVDRDAVDGHLLMCEVCSRSARLQGRWKAAVRGHLTPIAAPEDLRQRLEATLAAAPPATRRWPWEAHPRLAPALAAAVVLVAIVGIGRQRTSPLVEQAWRTYNASMPLDVVDSNCSSIAQWFRGKLDFAVHPPALETKKCRCQGGRLVNVKDRFGAYLVYQVSGGHRLSLMVVDEDEPVLMGARRHFLAGQDVSFASRGGASLGTWRDRNGLSYIVTSDLDEDSLRGVMEAAFQERN